MGGPFRFRFFRRLRVVPAAEETSSSAAIRLLFAAFFSLFFCCCCCRCCRRRRFCLLPTYSIFLIRTTLEVSNAVLRRSSSRQRLSLALRASSSCSMLEKARPGNSELTNNPYSKTALMAISCSTPLPTRFNTALILSARRFLSTEESPPPLAPN